MRIEIDISEEDYNIIKHNNAIDNPLCPLSQKEVVCIIANGMPISEKQECALKEIETEITQLASRYTISRERGGMGQVEWSDRLIKESDVLKIINKYRTKSEVVK